MWSDEESAGLQALWEKRGCLEDVATHAVELVAARSGTMTDERNRLITGLVEAGHTLALAQASELLASHDAQGARVAVLEAERDEWKRKAVEGGKRWQGQVDDLTSQLAALSVEMATVVGESRQPESPDNCACTFRPHASWCPAYVRDPNRCASVECRVNYSLKPTRACGFCDSCCGHARGVCALPERYPCSPTCTHDDAATPGHTERVKERSELVAEIGRRPENDSDTFRTIETGVEGVVFTRTQTERYADKKADAMRAACLIALAEVMEAEGYSDAGPGTVHGRLKAAIEGAAP